MATVLESFDWSAVSRNSDSPRTRTYPWDEWFDGRIWRLEPGTDFDGPAVSLERVIRTTANRRGAKVRVRITEGDYVVIQKHNGAPSRGITKSPKARVRKPRAKAAPAKAPAKASVNGNGAPAKPRRKLVKQ